MRLSPSAARWIEDELGPGARVIRSRPLRGGVASFIDDVTLAPGESTIHVIIRRYAEGVEGRARLVAREAENLEGLANSGIATRRATLRDTRPAAHRREVRWNAFRAREAGGAVVGASGPVGSGD